MVSPSRLEPAARSSILGQRGRSLTPRLSVVVPFYNVADYIAECLESLRRQTLEDIEVVLVDDGSQDATAEIAEQFCRIDPRFRLVVQANQGLGPARNTGVKHSEGEYITFVDSDDLVPRHAFETMVGSLDLSGSSLAAGNARRFDDYGAWNSWLHRRIFATPQTATHVTEYDMLAIDRMVWNKVFRRSFWDEFGYEFPAIRYEDYPVTLKAYLDAVTVDCVAQPIYYWRERTSGDSITQRKSEFANLRDRITSAEMVLDLVERQPSYIRHPVHKLLAQVDMVTLIEGFGDLTDPEAVRLAKLARHFAERVDKSSAALSSPMGRVQHHALRSGDIEMLRALAEIRRGGALGAVRATPSGVPWRRHELVPPNMRGQAKSHRGLFRLSGKAIYVTTTVTDLDWEADPSGAAALVVRGTAEIRHLQIDGTSKLRIVLEANGIELPVPVERFPAYDSHGDQNLVGYSVRVPHSMLTGLKASDDPATLRATITQGHVKRTALLRNVGPGNPSMPPGSWLTESSWLQPLPAEDNRLLLRHMIGPARLTSAAFAGDAIVLEGVLPAGSGELSLSRTWAREKLADCEIQHDTTGDRFTARIPLSGLIQTDDPDDPVTGRTVRRLEAGDADHPVLAIGLNRSVTQLHEGRLIQISRAADNCVVVTDGPVQPTADEVGLADGLHLITVSGKLWTTLDTPLVWRKVGDFAGEDDVVCSVAAGERWTAAVDVQRLIARSAREVRTTPTTWQLVGVPREGRPYAVQPDAFLVAEPSITILALDHQLTVRPHADRVTVEVR
jgi:Glycosyl transferase family 2